MNGKLQGSARPLSEAMFATWRRDGRGRFLKPTTKLSTSMTLTQFDNGYWYATDLKNFAKTIGIPSTSK